MLSTKEMIDHLIGGGFANSTDLIHVFQGGSHQHGAAIPGKVSDIDLFGVYIETPNKALGVSNETHFTGGTQDQYEKNRPGDEDYKCYTLNRWAGLACKGNPTILGFLYSPCSFPEDAWARYIVANRQHFQASTHAKSFLGYAKGQVARLDGTSGKGKHGQRPELETKFGYDTKAAMHLIRLLYEAEEYVLTGNITYPRPEKDLLLGIRLGEWTWDRLFKEYNDLEARVENAMERSLLPKHVDLEKVSEIITETYMSHWDERGLLNRYIHPKLTARACREPLY